MKLDRDAPRYDRENIEGKQGCIERLAQYFKRKENNNAQPKQMTPIDNTLCKEGWLVIDVLAIHDAIRAAHVREHEHVKRRKGYASATKRKHPASEPSDSQRTTIADLPNETLKHICTFLPFRDLQNLIEAMREMRDLSTIEKREGRSVDLTGEYLEEQKLRRIITRKATIFLNLTRAEIINETGTIETDIQVEKSDLEGICISMFRGPHIRIASIMSLLDDLTILDISYSTWDLIGEVSRAMGEKTKLRAINIGTSLFMMHCYPNDYEPIKNIIARLIRKSPQLRHFILHGLNLCTHAINHLHRHLPAEMKSIDIARNPKFTDDDARHLMTQCPDLAFLDMSETSVTLQIIGEIARTWEHSLISLALPNTAASLIKELHRTGGEALKFVIQCIRSMPALIYLRMGRWRMGTAP